MSGLEVQSRLEAEAKTSAAKDIEALCAEAELELVSLRTLESGEETRMRACAGALGKDSMQAHLEASGEHCAIPFVISGGGQYQLLGSDLVDGYVAECAEKNFVLAASGADGVFWVPQAAFKEFTSVVRMFAPESDDDSPRYLVSKKARDLPIRVLALTPDARAALKR